MTGDQLLTFTGNLLDGEDLDPTENVAYLEIIRTMVENEVEWQWLKSYDFTQTVQSGNNWQTPIPIPVKFRRYLKNGRGIILFDGQTKKYKLTQVKIEDQLEYKDKFGFFFIDLSTASASQAGSLYITGTVPATLQVWQFFIQNPGAITESTPWLCIPSEFHPLLSFELAGMIRLGKDYDDTGARNADDNIVKANRIRAAMLRLNTELALSSVEKVDKHKDYGNHIRVHPSY